MKLLCNSFANHYQQKPSTNLTIVRNRLQNEHSLIFNFQQQEASFFLASAIRAFIRLHLKNSAHTS